MLCSLIYFIKSSLDIPPASSTPSSSTNLSALYLVLQFLQSINGSENVEMCPDASHTLGFIKIALSNPTLLTSSWINFCFQAFLILFFNSAPTGPKSQVFASPPYISLPWNIIPYCLHKFTNSSIVIFSFIINILPLFKN